MESSSPFFSISRTFQNIHLAISAQSAPFRPSQKRLIQEETCVVEKSKTNDEFCVEDCRSVSKGIGFECMLKLGDAQSTKFEFGPCRYVETRYERSDWQHSIELSRVASRCKDEHQYGETRGGKRPRNPMGQNCLNTMLRYPRTMSAILSNLFELTTEIKTSTRRRYAWHRRHRYDLVNMLPSENESGNTSWTRSSR